MRYSKKIIMLILSFLLLNVYAVEINRKPSQKDIAIYEKNMRDYPDAAVAILLDDTFIDLEEDFSYTLKRRIIKKIINYKGKKEHSEFKIIYDKRYESVQINEAKTIKKSNNKYTVINIGKEAIREIDAPFDSGNMHYAVHKMRMAAFSSVEEGDIIDITYTIKNTKKNKFTNKILYAGKEPIYEKNFTLSYFKDKAPIINYRNWSDNLTIKKSEFGEKKVITWSGEYLEQIIPEAASPRLEYFLPTVFISFYKNWEEYKNLVYKKVENKIEITDKVKEIVNNKDINSLNIKDKIIYLKNYVAKNIEYKSVNDVLNFEARNVDQIIESGYAASMDRSTLLCSLLRAIDIEASPILVGNDKLYWDMLKNNLQVDDFQYMLVSFNLNNKIYYLETESEFYKFGEINCINEIGLLISGKKDFITEIDPQDDFYEKTVSEKNIALSNNGNAIINHTSKFYGIAAQQVRKKYTYMSPIKRKQDFETLISNISYSAKPISESLEIEYDSPAKISYKYSEEDFAVVDKDYYYFKLQTENIDFVLSEESKQRKYPYASLTDREEKQMIVLEIPNDYKLELIPENLEIDNKYIIFNRSLEMKKNKLIIKTHIKYKPFVISREEYNDFYNQMIKLFHPKHRLFLFKKR